MKRTMAGLLGLIWVLVVVSSLLVGNLLFRLLTPDLYLKTLDKNEVYPRVATAMLQEAGQATDRRDLLNILEPDDLMQLAEAINPSSSFHEIMKPVINDLFAYITEPDASTVITPTSAALHAHWKTLDIDNTCAVIPDDFAAVCNRDLPRIITYLQETTQTEQAIHLDDHLGASGSLSQLLSLLQSRIIGLLQGASLLLIMAGIISYFLKQMRKFWAWSGKLLIVTGLLITLTTASIYVATSSLITAIEDQTAREIQTTSIEEMSEISMAVTLFLGEIGRQFINGLWLQAIALLGIGILIYSYSHKMPKSNL